MNERLKNIWNETECPPDEKLESYVNRELSVEEVSQIEEHLTYCPICSDMVDGLKLAGSGKINSILTKSSVLLEKEKEDKKVITLSFKQWMGIAATFLGLLAISVYFLKDLSTSKQSISETRPYRAPENVQLSDSNAHLVKPSPDPSVNQTVVKSNSSPLSNTQPPILYKTGTSAYTTDVNKNVNPDEYPNEVKQKNEGLLDVSKANKEEDLVFTSVPASAPPVESVKREENSVGKDKTLGGIATDRIEWEEPKNVQVDAVDALEKETDASITRNTYKQEGKTNVVAPASSSDWVNEKRRLGELIFTKKYKMANELNQQLLLSQPNDPYLIYNALILNWFLYKDGKVSDKLKMLQNLTPQQENERNFVLGSICYKLNDFSCAKNYLLKVDNQNIYYHEEAQKIIKVVK